MEGTQLARLPNELLCRINDIVMQNTYTRSYTLPDGTNDRTHELLPTRPSA